MSDSEEDYEEKCLKIVIVGDGSAGKTSIINRFVNTQFNREYRQTMGVDFYSSLINLPGVSVRVKVWDIGGQTLGGTLLKGYIYGSNGILFVYDITNNNSFENIVDWLDTAKKIFESENKKMPYLGLVGNKVDLEHTRAVRIDKHEKFALDNTMSSHFVSAKTGDSVKLCVYSVVAEMVGVRLTQAELNRQKTVVRAEIQRRSVGGTESASGFKLPSDQSKLHPNLNSVMINNSNSTAMANGASSASISNEQNNNHNQENSQACCIL